MLVQSDNHIHIEHIMWQPQFLCESRCKHCYLKDSEVSSYCGAPNGQIIDLVFVNEQVGCNQFTISLDTVYKVDKELVEQLTWLWNYCNTKIDLGRYDNYIPKLCVTAQNISTVSRWASILNLSIYKFLRPISILSLSTLPSLGKRCEDLSILCKESNTILNFNKVIYGEMDNTQEKIFRIQCRYSDQIYIIFKKNTLGTEQDYNTLNAWLHAVSAAVDEVGTKKVYTDSCITESKRYLDKDLSCSACISKLSVWPDGSVTGCPYDTNLLRSARSDDVWANIQCITSRQIKHPIDYCTIPGVWCQCEEGNYKCTKK